MSEPDQEVRVWVDSRVRRTGRWARVSAAVLVLALSGCATENPALAPTQDAQVGVTSTLLLVDQVDAGSTLPTVATTTASDMLTIVADAERSLVALPAGADGGAADALAAVREAADAVAAVGDALATDGDLSSERAQLKSADAALSAAIDGMR